MSSVAGDPPPEGTGPDDLKDDEPDVQEEPESGEAEEEDSDADEENSVEG